MLLKLAIVDAGSTQGAQTSMRGAVAHLVQAGSTHIGFGLTKAGLATLM